MARGGRNRRAERARERDPCRPRYHGVMSDEIPLPALPPRPQDSHKASVGRVLVIGGSLGMAGAPVLAARGALRAGAGLVTVAVPERIRDVVSGFLPEVMTIGLPCDDDGCLESSARAAIEGYLERADAVVLGPGLGRAPCTEDAVLALLAAIDRPVVLDAPQLISAFLGFNPSLIITTSPFTKYSIEHAPKASIICNAALSS